VLEEGIPAEYPDPQVNKHQLENICRSLLATIGEDPFRPGLIDTPRRWANFWGEFIDYDPGNTGTLFEQEGDQAGSGIVVVAGIRVWSLCEHHLLPFHTDISIGYRPAGKVLGLSKFARVAHQFAHRLQLQENMVRQIADEISNLTETPDVAVVGTGVHLCMVMRGIREQEARMFTSDMRGAFLRPDLRAEFMAVVNNAPGR
jgi:GTP cyclohydrolase I